MIPLKECISYPGGCDPTGFWLYVREAGALFGFEAKFEMVFLMLFIAAVTTPVLFLSPLPETWRSVGLRIGAGVGGLFVTSWSVNLFNAHTELFKMGVILVLAVFGVVFWGAITVRRTLQLARNLRSS